MTTAQEITSLLNRREHTILQLAKALGLSRNSVNVQVGRLEAAGIVEKVRRTTGDGAGKPAWIYRTARGGEDAFSNAYRPVLAALVGTLGAEQTRAARSRLLQRAGRALAREAGLAPSGKTASDLKRAVLEVNALGAMAEAGRRDGQPYVSCHTCPVATLVHAEPLVCKLVAAFFAEATGQRVSVDCRRDRAVVCGFAFSS